MAAFTPTSTFRASIEQIPYYTILVTECQMQRKRLTVQPIRNVCSLRNFAFLKAKMWRIKQGLLQPPCPTRHTAFTQLVGYPDLFPLGIEAEMGCSGIAEEEFADV